jgi:histidine triad (HIT) family protein
VISHAPADYDCPFCRIVAGEATERTRPDQVVERTAETATWVNPRWWPNNAGSLVVVPTEHFENIFDLPDRLAGPIHAAARRGALALKSHFSCDGISTRQHNEPGGNQEVWHFHLHVFPRYGDDGLYGSRGEWADPDAVASTAEALRGAWPS